MAQRQSKNLDEENSRVIQLAKGDEDGLIHAIIELLEVNDDSQLLTTKTRLNDYVHPDVFALLTTDVDPSVTWETKLHIKDQTVIIRGNDQITVKTQ